MPEKPLVTTLKRLTDQRTKYQEQIIAIQEFERFLAELECNPKIGFTNLPVWVTFEIHLPAEVRGLVPIKTTGKRLSNAYDQAVALWTEYNGGGDHFGLAEVFVSNGNLFTALAPEDAARIALFETGEQFIAAEFYIDPRLYENSAGIIFDQEATLPKRYAKVITPPFNHDLPAHQQGPDVEEGDEVKSPS